VTPATGGGPLCGGECERQVGQRYGRWQVSANSLATGWSHHRWDHPARRARGLITARFDLLVSCGMGAMAYREVSVIEVREVPQGVAGRCRAAHGGRPG
jgi:hypothetical protein